MSEIARAILAACVEGPSSTPELLKRVGYRARTGNFKKALSRLLDQGFVVMTLPEKPRAKSQRYRLTALGRAYLTKNKEPK